ncbi:FadR family transcriptional regulator [Microaerobacter geothermalis]|nr:FadR family transcriptional regulator [Microaerobacter geothermalis]
MISKGILKPGDKLDSVRELAEKFNVGRSAVREALSALKAMGLVEMRQGEGTFISKFNSSAITQPLSSAVLMNPKEIKELLEVRKIMEVGIAGIAASKRDEEDLTLMREALLEMEKALDADDEGLGELADVKFHMAIAKSTKNKMLIKLMNNISGFMRETMKESRRIWLYAEEATHHRLYLEHKSIFQAIEEKNATLAQQRMLTHLVKVEEVVDKFQGQDR